MPIAAAQRTGISRWIHVKAGEFAILFVCAVTLFSLCTQALYLGFQGSTISSQLGISRAELILSVLPHALLELTALFLPLAAWLIASRRGEWNQLLAATLVTVLIAIPTLVIAATIEVYVWPHILEGALLRDPQRPRHVGDIAALPGREAEEVAERFFVGSAPWSVTTPKAIERKWQAVWAEEKTWEVPNPGQPGFDASKPKSYVLEMLPYPSGEPHVGHLKCYAVGDAIAHFRRRHGFEVIHPMGYDAFGLPAENNAIKTGEPPREATERSIESFRRQFREWGISIDWSREIATHTPEYYRWTQWIFLRLFERGLAYRTEAPVQWCPKDATVLANEQVVDGRCERCGTAGRAEKARAVVLQDHRLRRAPARRLRPARVLARARDHDAAQLDRPLRGRRGGLPLRGSRPRLPGLHHPARHALRRHLLRPRPRASRARAAGRRNAGRGGGARVRRPRRPRVGRGARRRGPREDRRAARPQRRQPGQRRGDPDVRRRLRADGVRHRRDHGGARATTRATTSSPRPSTCR